MFRILAVALLTLLAQGCATITRGTTQSWTVESDPIGADVTLSSGEHCTTPCTLKKKRKYGFNVIVAREGYETVHTDIVSATSGSGGAAMAGNVLIGGLIGLGVDAGSGATKDLKPNPLSLKLVPLNTRAEPGAPASTAPTAPATEAAPSEAAPSQH